MFRSSPVQILRYACFMLPLMLAAAEWEAENGFRSRPLAVPPGGRAFLQRVEAQATGIDFRTFISEEKAMENTVRTGGAGVAAGDVDGDGWCDLFFAGMENPPALFRNLGGWKFTNVTDSAGLK